MQKHDKNANPVWRKLYGYLTNNLGLKLLSIVLAIALWTLVVYSDDSITRSRTFSGLSAYLTGQTTLSDNYLALVSNPLENLSDITVEVEVPQTQYSRVTENHVRVRLDLSNVRSAGTQLVPLSVSCTYGTVKNVYPAAVEVEIEARDSRSVPMNTTITGKDDAYWYNVKALNPGTINVAGASSIVQDIAQGRVTVDVADMTETDTRAYPYQLFDHLGNEIPQELVTRSASSVSATVEVYPTKELPVNKAIEDVLIGSIATGYEVESVDVTPSTITIAAGADLLDDLTVLAVEPIQVPTVNQSFTVRTSLAKLSGIKYYSAEQVYVTVNVREQEDTVAFSEVPVTLLNLPTNLTVAQPPLPISVQVTGPYSDVVGLTAEQLQVTIDLTQAQAGIHSYPVQISVPGCAHLTYSISTPEIPLTLTERAPANYE